MRDITDSYRRITLETFMGGLSGAITVNDDTEKTMTDFRPRLAIVLGDDSQGRWVGVHFYHETGHMTMDEIAKRLNSWFGVMLTIARQQHEQGNRVIHEPSDEERRGDPPAE